MTQTSLTKDLTSGKPMWTLTLYAFPMLVSMFFQQAYNLVDSWISGNYIGSIALSAVGTCYPITVFYIAIASGLSMGVSLFSSQNFGAEKYWQVCTGVTTAYLIFLPFSLALSITSLVFSSSMLEWLAVPAEAIPATSAYLRIYLLGLPFLFLYNMGNGVLNGLGNSKLPLIFLIFSCGCNIVLDLVFVIVIPMGITGIALATLLSQAFASIATSVVVRITWLRLDEDSRANHHKNRRFSISILKELLKLGIPSVLQHGIMSAGQLFLQSIINSYGLIVMAGYSVAFRINGLVVNSLMSVSNALSGYLAQNQGAGKTDRMKQGVFFSLLISFLFSAAMVALLRYKGTLLLSLFVEDSAQKKAIIDAGMGFLKIVSPFYLLVCFKIISDGALRGIGAMIPFTLATGSDVVIRIAFGQYFSARWGIQGVWWIWPLAWMVGTGMSVGFYRKKKPF